MDSDGEDLENIFEEYENNEDDAGAENTENKSANETSEAVKIAAPKRIVKNPRLKFNADRLCGERGIPVLMDHFKNVKFKGPGHEKEDLDKLLAKLEHWTHRLFPSMKFEDCLNHIERLGKKRPVQTCLRKIRLDMPILNNDFVKDNDNEDDDVKRNEDSEPEEISAFDRLLGEREEIPTFDTSTPENFSNSSSFYSSSMPNIATGHVLGSSSGSNLTAEQKERIERNKMLAAERRKARLAAAKENNMKSQSENHETLFSENVLSKQNSPNKLLNLPEHNEENSVSSLETSDDFNKNLKDSSYNYDNSEKLGLDDLMNLVNEEDPVSDENRMDSPPEQVELCSDNVNKATKFSLNDADNSKNFESVLEMLENKNFPSSKNSTRENLNIESSLDLICENSEKFKININAGCSTNDILTIDENVIMKNKDLISVNYEDDSNIDKSNKFISDDSEKTHEDNLNMESSFDLVGRISVSSELKVNTGCSLKDISVNEENENLVSMDCDDENS